MLLAGEEAVDEEAQAAAEKEAKKDVTPSDIFVALQSDADDTELSMAEFKRIFDLLELDLTDSQKEMLFSFCDSDCSGSISEKEFVEGWEKMVQVFLEHAAHGSGLSTVQIVGIVTYMLIVLALGIVFILLALSAWTAHTSFGASVQTGSIVGLAQVTSKMRRKTAAEDPDKLDAVVAKQMSAQGEAAQDR